MNPQQAQAYEKPLQNMINTYFNKIYIINLQHRTDRWEKLLVKLKKYNIDNQT